MRAICRAGVFFDTGTNLAYCYCNYIDQLETKEGGIKEKSKNGPNRNKQEQTKKQTPSKEWHKRRNQKDEELKDFIERVLRNTNVSCNDSIDIAKEICKVNPFSMS